MLGALVLAAFPQVVLGLQTFVIRDYGFFAYPLACFQRESFWRGELPLWNPYSNCGVPFLAQWNTMPLYPPALIYLLLPLEWSLGMFCLLHLVLAGMGSYFLARRWTGDTCAAGLAGVIFAFNGLSLNLLMWPSHIATLSWMPWVVLATERARQEGGRAIAVAALVGALQMLAGGPETILLTWVLVLGLAIADWMRSPSPPVPRRSSVLRLATVVLLVAGLAAAQLLPFLDLAMHSQRGQDYADTRWSMPSWGWGSFLVPRLFGSVWGKGVFFQYDQAWTSSYYLGVGALLLACLAAWWPRERRYVVLSLAAGLALLLSFGEHTFVYRWARVVVPQISMMTYPVKFVLVLAFAVPLLAGFAFAQLRPAQEGAKPIPEQRVLALGGVLLLLMAAILVWAWRFPFPTDDFPATLRNGAGRAACLVAAVILLVWVARTANPAHRQMLSLALVALFWLDVWTHVPPQNPTVPPWVYQPGLARAKLAMNPQPELGGTRAMVSPAAEMGFRGIITSDPRENFLAKRLGYFANCNLLDAVPKVNGFFSLYPHECGELSATLYGSTNRYLETLADFMCVSQITAPGPTVEWQRRQTFMPLITAGQAPIFLDDTNALRALLRPGFNPRTAVILPPEAKGRITATNSAVTRVTPGQFTATRVNIEVDAPAPSLLVIAQTYYHPWRAYVDDRPTPLLRANYAFQAVETPAGHHRVRLAYEDHAFYLGIAISACAAVTCLGFSVLRLKSKVLSRHDPRDFRP